VHNGWRNLNPREKEILLEEPNSAGICHGTDTICLEHYIEDPLVAITFSIVFTATLPIRPAPKTVSQTVAWQIFMPKINM
jgi:hypothetical protein